MKKTYIIPTTDLVKVQLHRGILDENVDVIGNSKESEWGFAAEGKAQGDFEDFEDDEELMEGLW